MYGACLFFRCLNIREYDISCNDSDGAICKMPEYIYSCKTNVLDDHFVYGTVAILQG